MRKEVADFISSRNGGPFCRSRTYFPDRRCPSCCPNGIKLLIACSRNHDPNPQYPLYSAAIALNGGRAVGYYLNENSDWSTDSEELKRALEGLGAQKLRCVLLLSLAKSYWASNVSGVYGEILGFCHEENLVLLADEVYQENIWLKGETFTSFKKVLRDMEESGALPAGEVELLCSTLSVKDFMASVVKVAMLSL